MSITRYSSIFSVLVTRFGGAASLAICYAVTSRSFGIDTLAGLAYFISVLNIVSVVGRFGADQLFLREVPKMAAKYSSDLVGRCLFISFAFTSVFSAYCIYKSNLLLAVICIIFVAFSVLSEAYRARGLSAVYSAIRNLSFNLGLLFFFTVSSLGAHIGHEETIYGIALASLASLLLALIVYYRKFEIRTTFLGFLSGFDTRLFLSLAPIATYQSIIVMQSHGYNIFLAKFGSAMEVSFFTIFLQIGLVFTLISTSITVDRSLPMSIQIKDGQYQAALKSYFDVAKISAAILTPAYVIVLLLGPWIVFLIFDINMGSHSLDLYVFSTASFINGILGPKHTSLSLLGKEKLVLVLCILSALASALFGMLLLNTMPPLTLACTMYFIFSLSFSLSTALSSILILRSKRDP